MIATVNWDNVETAAVMLFVTLAITGGWVKLWKVIPERIGKALTPVRRKTLKPIGLEVIDVFGFTFSIVLMSRSIGVMQGVYFALIGLLASTRYLFCLVRLGRTPLVFLRDAFKPNDELNRDSNEALQTTMRIYKQVSYIFGSTSVFVIIALYVAIFHSPK